MSERIAIDTNAAVDFIRPNRTPPPQLAEVLNVLLPVTVAGELFAGAYSSRRKAENLALVEHFLTKCTVLTPDPQTARIYGQLRGETRFPISTSRLNDLWIAALCLQHDLPLLTNDRGFDVIPGLTTIHW